MQLVNKSTFYFLACASFIVGLCVQDFFKIPLTGGIIVLGLTWIITRAYTDKIKVIATKPLALAVIVYFLIHIISVSYSDNSHLAWKDVQLKITLLLMPLFMLSTSLFSQKLRQALLKIFAISMAVMASADLVYAYSDYLVSDDVNVFFYKSLPHFLVNKPHYVAWHYSFALFVVFFELFQKKSKWFFWTLIALILLISLVLLSSRAYLFAFGLVLLISIVKLMQTYKYSTKRKLAVILIAIALPIFSLLIPQIKSRIVDTFVEVKELFGTDTNKETNARVYIWKYAYDLILQKPITGYGVGDAKAELNVALRDCKAMFWDGKQNIPIYAKNYNFHNQFLQSWAEVGLIGFLLLLYIILRPFYLKDQHPLFLIFIGLTFVGFMTESMFERQAGVVFFAIMYPLLMELKKEPKDSSTLE